MHALKWGKVWVDTPVIDMSWLCPLTQCPVYWGCTMQSTVRCVFWHSILPYLPWSWVVGALWQDMPMSVECSVLCVLDTQLWCSLWHQLCAHCRPCLRLRMNFCLCIWDYLCTTLPWTTDNLSRDHSLDCLFWASSTDYTLSSQWVKPTQRHKCWRNVCHYIRL